MDNQKYEVVKFVDNGFELEVNVSPQEDTVWLTQEQIALLFNTTKQNISLHIKNIITEEELDNRTVKESLTVQNEGLRKVNRVVYYYNLDMIISVGFRVKSHRGIVFRRWANSVLKQYLLKGYAIDPSRVVVTADNYLNLVNVVNKIDDKQIQLENRIEVLENTHPEFKNKLFFKGQLWDAISLIEDIISEATESIILIDNYVDKKTLDLLSKKKEQVRVEIFTSSKGYKLTKTEVDNFNNQYRNLVIRNTEEFHDRFIILDGKKLYHVGASIKDAGKKAFAISLIEDFKQYWGALSKIGHL